MFFLNSDIQGDSFKGKHLFYKKYEFFWKYYFYIIFNYLKLF